MKSNLTDSIIQAYITKHNNLISLLSLGSLICFALILVIILIAMIFRIKKIKQDPAQIKLVRKNIVGLCITCLIFAFIISGVFYIRQMTHKAEQQWTISVERVSLKNVFKDYDSNGKHFDYEYQIFFDGYSKEINVPKDTYFKIEVGEEVYLVCDVYGDPINLWDMNEYNYSGERWKK